MLLSKFEGSHCNCFLRLSNFVVSCDCLSNHFKLAFLTPMMSNYKNLDMQWSPIAKLGATENPNCTWCFLLFNFLGNPISLYTDTVRFVQQLTCHVEHLGFLIATGDTVVAVPPYLIVFRAVKVGNAWPMKSSNRTGLNNLRCRVYLVLYKHQHSVCRSTLPDRDALVL